MTPGRRAVRTNCSNRRSSSQTVRIDGTGSREATDENVRAEVEMLLACDNAAGDFPSEPVLQRHQDLLADDETLCAGRWSGRTHRAGTWARRHGRGVSRFRHHARTFGRTESTGARDGERSAQRQRLVREARAAAQISHPGICTVYALEERGDEFVIASEYIDGRSLRETSMPAEDHRRRIWTPSSVRSSPRLPPPTPAASCIAISSRKTSCGRAAAL